VPAQSATVSRGVNSQLIEESVNDLELVSRIIHFYRKPFLQESETKELLRKVQAKVSSNIIDIKYSKMI
jgi:phosphoribosylformylglycinamidine synthase